ncbi:MFS family permease [Mycetocola sp. BIGb0189]|uniref:MFS transporter n=1 Tax=Mycetocola sp. BIGb0189 TaxID=2940604 RepID=UPI00216AA1D1|nr:MFS transporter [Mycetocola sp. BIGb0189]MCS4276888.1 MFS family permease [Mycetocola sp. BIGb0189]
MMPHPPITAPDPGALIPETPVSRRWIAAFTLAWFGYWMASLVPLQLLLPSQFQALNPGDKVRDLAITNGVAGVVALVTLPVFGALCDRTISRFGRRRLWIAGGAFVGALAVALVGEQTSTGGVVLWWAVATAGASAMMGGLTAVIADRVPERQRGILSSAIYGPQALGVVIGIAAVTLFALQLRTAYQLLGIALVLCAIPFVWIHRERRGMRTPPLTFSAIASGLWVNPRRHPEFAWAFGSRTLVNLANSLGTCYMLFFLTDGLQMDSPEDALLIVTLVYLAAALAFTYLAGLYSDRTGRQRGVLIIAGLAQALAAALLVFAPSFVMAIIAAAFIGGGFGASMSVGQAVVTRVLPDAENRAKDLGIMNIGLVVPTTIAPLIAAILITTSGGYTLLFAATAVFALGGVWMITRLRSIR